MNIIPNVDLHEYIHPKSLPNISNPTSLRHWNPPTSQNAPLAHTSNVPPVSNRAPSLNTPSIPVGREFGGGLGWANDLISHPPSPIARTSLRENIQDNHPHNTSRQRIQEDIH
ncbi:hypothetical protein JAAARDRAFT_42257 [Jaapia argillacea MUCL 33604]|uniref:Uncharacterized protein n=1 Tax=Jaapia argillacea MUCL 33604 TaxID=933084 RepID=A0A067P8V1_9AGAM|nr:hypothetical protein JAAARDRAFT_42257 [Jaapia argillacea MUCL 33604]